MNGLKQYWKVNILCILLVLYLGKKRPQYVSKWMHVFSALYYNYYCIYIASVLFCVPNKYLPFKHILPRSNISFMLQSQLICVFNTVLSKNHFNEVGEWNEHTMKRYIALFYRLKTTNVIG